MDEERLRYEIQKIRQEPGLSTQDKTRKIQKLMTKDWMESKTREQEDIPGLTPSYANGERGDFGCQHYKRECKIKAKCCGKLFTCRLCHDEKSDHKIDRYATEEMMCMHCLKIQSIGPECLNEACDATFMAAYYCEYCKFFDNTATKQIYHCQKCGLCRIGKGVGIDFFHCDSCNACISMTMKEEHKCIERSLESDCPICNEFMFTSRKPVTFLPCGHAMHQKCHSKYIRTNFTCPICKVSILDMKEHFERIDEYVSNLEIPEEYKDYVVEILCNDCLMKSHVPYKLLYHKCDSCFSFNTNVLNLFKNESPS